MNLEKIFVGVFAIAFIGFMLYSVCIIIISEVENHRDNKEMRDNTSKKERDFKKKIWR